MSRIDVQTLVLAFERRISELEKNPPDKVSTGVIVNMLEKSIDEIIKDHFRYLINIELRKQIKTIFKGMKSDFVTKVLDSILNDEEFRKSLQRRLKESIINGIK